MFVDIFTRKVPITELTDCALSSRAAQLLCPPALLDAVLVGERHPSERGNLIKVFNTGLFFNILILILCMHPAADLFNITSLLIQYFETLTD